MPVPPRWPGLYQFLPLTRFGHRPHRFIDGSLDLLDQAGDFLGRCSSALGQIAHLIGNDGKALALRPGTGSLDGSVERQQIGLRGNVTDGFDNDADLAMSNPLIKVITNNNVLTETGRDLLLNIFMSPVDSVCMMLRLFCRLFLAILLPERASGWRCVRSLFRIAL